MSIQINNYLQADGRITRSINPLDIPGSKQVSNEYIYTLVSRGKIKVTSIEAGKTEYTPEHLIDWRLNESCA